MAEAEWTLIVFFASDNDLSPLLVSQLKDIKNAGFQLNTNVLVHFDPNEKGAPTTILDVNRKRREGKTESEIGDGTDPYVRNISEDIINPAAISRRAGAASKKIAKKLANPDGMTAD